ncbi:MAG: ATP-dependent Clp protease ATP-binding subunit ClpX [Lachnospiraceae bacterium]|nr:ATP-dependent Clp protease ATP-binding subunit ClpX [Lachnospiraceae bacterium]
MNNNDEKRYCQLCHRSQDQVKDMFRIGDGFDICSDCMHTMLNSISSMNKGGGFNPFGANMVSPEDISAILNNTVNNEKKDDAPGAPGKPSESVPSANDDLIKEVSSATKETFEKKEDGDEKDDGNNNGSIPNFGFPGVSFLNMSDLQGMLSGRPKYKKSKNKEKTAPVIDINNIPRPDRIKAMLDEYIVGQDHAKKVMSVAVYNHYKRVASETMDKNRFSKNLEGVEIEKSNMLMIGPTGCGKTYMVKTLARLLDVPLAIADATSLTEAGYIGDDIESVVTKLLTAADNDVDKAETGIIFIDEIDKIAKKKNTNTRDVSGESVQQGMLKLLEGSEIEVPVGSNSKNAMVPMATVNTRNILFICGGAFPDLDEIIKQRLRKQTSIGFNAELKDTLDKRKDILKEVTVEDVKKFGMIPEFVGRLPVIFSMEGLSEEMLVDILKEPKNAIIKQYQKLFAIDEVDLKFSDDALHEIAKKAIEKDTGARALRSIIEEFMLDIMYEIPKDDNIGRVTITRDYILGKGGPVIELRGMDIKQEDLIGLSASNIG